MPQAAALDGFAFDGLPSFEDSLATTCVDVGRRQVLQALVVSAVVVMIDEGSDLRLEIARRRIWRELKDLKPNYDPGRLLYVFLYTDPAWFDHLMEGLAAADLPGRTSEMGH